MPNIIITILCQLLFCSTHAVVYGSRVRICIHMEVGSGYLGGYKTGEIHH